MIKMKCIVIIITITIAVTCPVFIVSYADIEDVSASSSESNNTEGESSVEEEPVAASKMQLLSTPPAGEIFEGGVGKGALLSPLLSESFQTDLATGSATVSVPIITPPGRKNMQPNISLYYSSNNPNGICGVGWGLTTSSIQRSTKKGLPKYDFSDTFAHIASGSSGDLVLIDEANKEYRQKIEGSFSRYIFDTVNSEWYILDKSGAKYTFGSVSNSRLSDDSGTKIFAWFLDRVEDVYGNAVAFVYEEHDLQVYLSRVEYTSNNKASPALAADKSVEFIYETGRGDILYNNRSGWEIQTTRRLKEIQIKVDSALRWKYVLTYRESSDTGRSLLTEIRLFDKDGNSLPPKKFTYQNID